MKFVIITSIFVLIQSLDSASLGTPQFEIHDGNCSKAVASDLVFQKHVHLKRVPFVTRDDTVSYIIIYPSEKLVTKNTVFSKYQMNISHLYTCFNRQVIIFRRKMQPFINYLFVLII